MSTTPAQHPDEPHGQGIAARLNWLRAGVLGANDGIVSAATPQVGAILTAGAAGLVGGALSMAVGEYISVSSQSDSQRALIAKERAELLSSPDEELAELAGIYESRGLTADTARQVAIELTAHDALAAHLSAELNIDETEVASPWAAAVASAIAFVSGAILPLAAILLLPQPVRIPLTFAIVVLALAGTGALGARVGGSPLLRATIRVTVGGALALAATFLIGSLLGTTGVA
jgi:VIT1/CCC1 family predicted Fe2+/Mn2+ transporter